MSYAKILKSLAEERELIVPWLENAILADNWPDSYQVKIDSGPYYGHGDGYFHPSTHALMGARELYLRFHPNTRDKIITERRSLQSHMTLAMGSALHGVVQTQLEMAGLCKPEDIEVDYLNKEHHVRGRIDFIVNHPDGRRIICEMKTINTFGFNKQEVIKDTWDAQLSIALDSMGHDFGVLLALESGFPYRMREYIVPRNDALLSKIYTKFDAVREAIALDTPPKPCCPLDSQQMTKCPARFCCWMSDDPELRP